MADSEKLINELLKKLNTGFSDQDSFNSLYEFVESDLKSLSQGLLQSWKPSPEQEKKLGMLLAIPGIHVQAKIVEKLSQGNKVSGFEALSGDKTFYVMFFRTFFLESDKEHILAKLFWGFFLNAMILNKDKIRNEIGEKM